ncbi:hypothetical protein B6D87_06520 [Pseudomonas fragi]|nr:hypothetical protein B6D87_06520 [Pseudomonas fragi]
MYNEVRPLGRSRDLRFLLAVVLKHLLSKSLVRRRNQPAAVDEMKRLDKAYCYTVRRLCISTLHVSLIIRVLPRAESAAGWHLPCSPKGEFTHHG